jgi:hypothetical protein
MPDYSPVIIEEQAERLYEQARKVITRKVANGFILGSLIATFVGFFIEGVATKYPMQGGPDFWALVIGIAIVAATTWRGYTKGKELAFQYHLEAQRLLVLVRIEENTRKSWSP